MSEIFGEAAPAADRPRRTRRRGRGGVTALVILLVLVVLAVVGYWLSDRLARQAVEDVVAGQVEAKLPENVSGDVDVTLGGGWSVAQIIAGRFDEMSIDAPDLTADGVELSAHATLTGIPRNTTDPVDTVAITVSTDAAQLAGLDLLPVGDGDVELGDGTLSYAGTQDVLGIAVGYRVTVEPSVADGQVLLTPVDASVDAGGLNLDAQPLVDRILGGDPVVVCVADRLPSALTLSDVDVTAAGVALTATGSELPLSGSGLSTLGSCE
ncbi:LmeA family phospholipid-binding protein [Mycetocola reblochoni]|uniref:Secreted protein n=2 Tax=Mycetocola reblochoni TaxID=331618 RepID=A0A1R4JU29_9MICO|nr:DUF2993 domain-containing protein [Mycetocola reblochoni]SJN35273.1 hypothetical protein FM119_09340 [Mycetocola reblochoni REB411]